MPTELEEVRELLEMRPRILNPADLTKLVGFLAHGNRQIRNVALENLVPFSLSEPSIFKSNNCVPVHSLKLLVRDSDPVGSVPDTGQPANSVC